MRTSRPAGSCHGCAESGGSAVGSAARPGSPPRADRTPGTLRVLLLGGPNVGKSVLFHRLTGRYTTVSNYPGTTVEVARGHGTLDGVEAEVSDTPGVYSLSPTTEEERVTRRLVLDGGADVLVHVVDAKNLQRSLALTLELAELGLPLVVALNMTDEAEDVGMRVDADALSRRLGAPVVQTVAVSGRGLDELREAIRRVRGNGRPRPPSYGEGVEEAVGRVRSGLAGDYPVDRRAVATLLLQGDQEVEDLVRAREGGAGPRSLEVAREEAGRLGSAPGYRLAVERQRAADRAAAEVVRTGRGAASRWIDRLDRWLCRPLTGVPILLAVLYLGLYQFVGVFGAGTVVDWLEAAVFEGAVNPFFQRLFAGIPWDWARGLYVGEYGLLTLGLRYAVAIILPVVGAFFLFFSVLEDSGYFPRLAMLVDRSFKKIGLSGRAVIPIVLGFACDTMATMVTRTLETKRERVLATLLLALAVPCSAQLGVILAVLAGHPAALGIWALVVLATFMVIGALGARVLRGERSSFHMELPPLRVPRPANVLSKTASRMHWYFLEVLPLFLLASVLLWAGDLTGLLGLTISGLEPVAGALGLPHEAARVFLFGFFRRDYGAAGLFDLSQAGLLDPVQLTVAAVTLTLFVPCIAQFLMMVKERGKATALGMFGFAIVVAFGTGFVLNALLRAVGA